MKNMSEINMHQNFLNKDKFIQKPLKMCKVFKVKPLNAPKLDVPSRNTAYNLFCKHMQKVKKKSQGGRVSKASAIISEEWKRVKASDKKMKKYRVLYEEEKQRHEEVLQRYQEDEMEIINLNKKGKAKKASAQPKEAPRSPEEPKKASGPSDGKKATGEKPS